MKTLRDYHLNLPGGVTGEKNVTWTGTYTPPIHAEVNGIPVRVLNIGDLPGASTVYNCADETGFSTPVKQTDTILRDGAYLPLASAPIAQSMR